MTKPSLFFNRGKQRLYPILDRNLWRHKHGTVHLKVPIVFNKEFGDRTLSEGPDTYVVGHFRQGEFIVILVDLLQDSLTEEAGETAREMLSSCGPIELMDSPVDSLVIAGREAF